jgi:hypothetical protein
MYRKGFKVIIIDKKTKGLFRTKYFITIQFEDGRTVEKEVPEYDFYNMNVQSEMKIVMYSYDNIRWVFNQNEL